MLMDFALIISVAFIRNGWLNVTIGVTISKYRAFDSIKRRVEKMQFMSFGLRSIIGSIEIAALPG